MIDVLVLLDPLWAPLCMLLLGLASVYFGARLVPGVLALAGLLLGLVVGPGVGLVFSSDPGFLRAAPWIFGLLFALISGFLVRMALFLAGAFLAVAAAMVFMPEPSVYVVIPAAVLGGVLACAARNPLFVVLSALFGSLLAGSGVVALAANLRLGIGVLPYFFLMAVLFLSGLWVQFSRGRTSVRRAKRTRR